MKKVEGSLWLSIIDILAVAHLCPVFELGIICVS